MLELIAHAGEVHESSNESLIHYLGVWYIALAVFVVGTYVLATLVYSLTKKSLSKTLAALLVVYLAAGFTLYEKSPVISVLSIFFGFILVAFVAFGSLMLPSKK
jgi:hypothetical protein